LFTLSNIIEANNIEELSNNRPVIAFDLLGFGRSSRPSFSIDPKVAETQFIESIEDWRKQMGLEEFVLLGHGFGAYIATAYTLKHPKPIKGLILADAWGFQESKNESRPETPIPTWLSVLTQVSQIFSTMFIYRMPCCLGIKLLKKLRPDIGRRYL
jgi:pimeloyl-ACP methyl ester carboxylesterase